MLKPVHEPRCKKLNVTWVLTQSNGQPGILRECSPRVLWTFVHLEGVEPTNNNGERAIRSGVLWRKISFGSHSAQGSHFVETMLSVVTTLKQQQRNVLDYLTAACQAALCDQPVPSLLPEGETAPSDQTAA